MTTEQKLQTILDSYQKVSVKDIYGEYSLGIDEIDAYNAMQRAYKLGLQDAQPKEKQIDYHISPRQTKLEF